MTHLLVAQQITNRRQEVLEKLKNAQITKRLSLQKALNGLSKTTKSTKSIARKCYDVKTPCGISDGVYTEFPLIDQDVYLPLNVLGSTIEYDDSAVDPGWYFYVDNNAVTGDLYYNPAPPGTLPLSGWVYAVDGCGTPGQPANLTITAVTCPEAGICREVMTDCGTFGGKYRQFASLFDLPFLLKDDNSSVMLFLGVWVIMDIDLGPMAASMAATPDGLPPLTGWVAINQDCNPATTIVSVKDCSCEPAIAAVSTPAVTGTLSAANCPLMVQFPVTGDRSVVSGPGGFMFSSVYRNAGNYVVNSPVRQPGTYTVNVSATNECGYPTIKTMTFVVSGQGCN